MKKTMILTTMLLVSFTAFAQPRKYRKAMEHALEMLQETSTVEGYLKCADAFDEISVSFEEMWMPPYYAAFNLISASFEEGDYGLKQEYLARAGLAIDKAMSLKPEESEVVALSAFRALGMMAADPETNGPIYLEDFSSAVQRAKALNPDNPRPYYMDGLLKENMPEFMGGGAAAARPIYLLAAEKFRKFQSEDPFWPDWGEELNQAQLDRQQ
jgi:hypothetical protein